ncbi:uncharacterized protein LOC127795812 [Diospyros lotus]|uniref:uncharacterized protein LOC127795812 n=1 Tax=Diospyros lotus TaxID=55363 RepID=UPI00225ACEFD|nr:uncharacterized protein LOC127795812 [Diospyros lotus]
MAVALSSPISLKAVSASWDTHQRLPYNPHRTTPKKPQTHKPTTLYPPTATATPTPSTKLRDSSTSTLLILNTEKITSQGKMEDTYLGYDTWLPSPPKVKKPRSIYNAASLAYIGDCVYELYARRHFLFPPLNIEEYNSRVTAVVRCEAQDTMLKKLLNENYLSEEERDVLRWGKNISSAKTRTKRRVGVAAYNRASSLETLIGYLYLTNVNRLEEIMLKLGFSCGTSSN